MENINSFHIQNNNKNSNESNDDNKIFNNFSKSEEQYYNHLEKCKLILSKEFSKRTLLENNSLINYLTKYFEYFKILSHNDEKELLLQISKVLKFKQIPKNTTIINYKEEIKKLYIIVKGSVSIYKPLLIKKKITLLNYLLYLNKLKNQNNILKYNRIIEKNKEENIDINLLSKTNNSNPILIKEYNLYIEEDEKIGNFYKGFHFGEKSLNKIDYINYTIKTNEQTEFFILSKLNYNKSIENINNNKIENEIIIFQNEYKFFKFFSSIQCLKLLEIIKNSLYTINKGEYLYKQNDLSENIYIIKSGSFEIFNLISYGWIKKFLNYIVETNENNLIKFLMEKGIKFNDEDLLKYYNKLIKKSINSPCEYNPFKLTDKIIEKYDDQSYYDIFNKKEEIKNKNNLIKINIIKINNDNNKDIFGLIDSVDLKKRFVCMKCISEIGEYYKISLYDFFKIINLNINDGFREKLMKFIYNRKEILYQQLVGGIKNKKIFIDIKYNLNMKDIKKNNYNIKKYNDKKTELIIEKIPDKIKENINNENLSNISLNEYNIKNPIKNLTFNYNNDKSNKNFSNFLYNKKKNNFHNSSMNKNKTKLILKKNTNITCFNTFFYNNNYKNNSYRTNNSNIQYKITSSFNKNDIIKSVDKINKSINIIENINEYNYNNYTNNEKKNNATNNYGKSPMITEINKNFYNLNNYKNNNTKIKEFYDKNFIRNIIKNRIFSANENFNLSYTISKDKNNKYKINYDEKLKNLNKNNDEKNNTFNLNIKNDKIKNFNFLKNNDLLKSKKIFFKKDYKKFFYDKINTNKSISKFKLFN